MAEQSQEVPLDTSTDPTQFDLTTSALLVGIDAEKYVDIFRKRNIGQSALVELTDEDLIKLGIDDEEVRIKLLNQIKNLPIYEECCKRTNYSNLGLLEILEILQETKSHLHLLHLSALANTLSVRKHKNLPDCLLYRDKYTSDIALSTIREINIILNTMDKTISTHFKEYEANVGKYKYKKILIGTVGAAAIGTLAVLFYKSLKEL